MLTKWKLRRIVKTATRVAAWNTDPARAVWQVEAFAKDQGLDLKKLRVKVVRPSRIGFNVTISVEYGRHKVKSSYPVQR